jgi:hypothetical protein
MCLRYCAVTFRGLNPENITVTGQEAHDPSVVKLLADELQIPCIVTRPLDGVDVSRVEFGGNRRETLAEWAICTGMAIRGIEFGGRGVGAGHEQRRLSA